MRTVLRPLLILVLFLLIGIGAFRLTFDVEVLNLLPSDSPVVQGLQLYQENFANAQELIIALEAPEASMAEEAALTLAEKLRQANGLAAEVWWQPPWNEYPAQTAELTAYLWFNQPPEVFASLLDRLSPPQAVQSLEATRQQLAISFSPEELVRLSYDPFQILEPPAEQGSGAVSLSRDPEIFASRDGRFRLIFVEASSDLRNYRECVRWLAALEDQIAQWRWKNPELSRDVIIGLTGRPAFVSEIAGGMERDIHRSAGGTLLVIGILFALAHRSWRPLLWLLALLAFTLAATFALGGLVFGSLSVVSAGFAAILLGLAADYALVLYQEHRAFPSQPLRTIQRHLAPGIFWSAVSTACAFLLLNAGGLPGLGQLGTLVAMGVLLAAFIMVYVFLPPLVKAEQSGGTTPALESGDSSRANRHRARHPIRWVALSILLFAAFGWIIWTKGPGWDSSPDALRPRQSGAYATLERIQERMERTEDPVWLVITGDSVGEAATRLGRATEALESALSAGAIKSFNLPAQLWPRPDFQERNRPVAAALAEREGALAELALENGFAPSALALTSRMFEGWREAASSRNGFWPDNEISRWLFRRFTARSEGRHLVLGLIYEGEAGSIEPPAWEEQLPGEGVWLASWERLGREIFREVRENLFKLLLPLGVVLVLVLALAFRRPRELALSLSVLAFSAAGLWAVMGLFGWSWNLMNLMALPLLLGAGVDYSIHIQMALRRRHGDLRTTRRTVGKALLLCSITTFTAFASLAISSNAGLASLGKVCAAGIAVTAVASIVLLPMWWSAFEWWADQGADPGAGKPSSDPKETRASQPASIYRAEFWRMGMAAARWCSPGQAEAISRALSRVYWKFNPTRREMVAQNLLPAAGGDQVLAEAWSRELFGNFAVKLADLLRYESGLPVDDLFVEVTGWEHFHAARDDGRGVLLLTPHLGNWEFGAPLLAKAGFDLLVITQPEPHGPLTEVREQSRAERGVETLVIGDNPFAFVELIRRLEDGAIVALLVDRPPFNSGVPVELFGRPFMASVAAAELARASGCALLPVYLPRLPQGYAAHVLPMFEYDRQRLGKREERQRLTQQMMRVFEPVIREYITQWYQFVPIWPVNPASSLEIK
jgi:uncharacterized protein